jgi:hypothetical protein
VDFCKRWKTGCASRGKQTICSHNPTVLISNHYQSVMNTDTTHLTRGQAGTCLLFLLGTAALSTRFGSTAHHSSTCTSSWWGHSSRWLPLDHWIKHAKSFCETCPWARKKFLLVLAPQEQYLCFNVWLRYVSDCNWHITKPDQKTEINNIEFHNN